MQIKTEVKLHTCYNGQNREHGQCQMLVRMWSTRNSHSLLVGMQNGTATLEDSLAVSYKSKHVLIIQSSNHTPWCIPKGAENYGHTVTCTWMFTAALFYNCQNLEATKISFSRCSVGVVPHVDVFLMYLWGGR